MTAIGAPQGLETDDSAPERRQFIKAVAAAGVITMVSPTISQALGEKRDRSLMTIPAGSCDCHVHALDPTRFPFQPKRRYTPGPATTAQMIEFHRSLGIERAVIVQNSVYGADNRCLVDAVEHFGGRARGVAVVADDVSDEELQSLHRAGVRGARVNLSLTETADIAPAARALAAADRLPPGWHVSVNAPLSLLSGLSPNIANCARRVVLEHFAHAQADLGISQPGFSVVIDLLKSGKVFVKLSAPYQILKDDLNADVAAVAKAYLSAAPNQVVWGSDWPHTGGAQRSAETDPTVIEPFRQVDDNRNLNMVIEWAGSRAVLEQVLVKTPEHLYDFPSMRR
jgi:predicted TIM-barrel fold metal-dependent hydrolase